MDGEGWMGRCGWWGDDSLDVAISSEMLIFGVTLTGWGYTTSDNELTHHVSLSSSLPLSLCPLLT